MGIKMSDKLSINWQFLVAFFALIFAAGEMHELVHTNVGYLLGGCYGSRDFNGWQLCEASSQHPYYWLSTLSGPFFTFVMLWVGHFMVKKSEENVTRRALGLAVLLGSFPFGRIFTVLLKGGDEYLVMRSLFNNGEHDNLLWLITTIAIIAICLTPMMTAWKALPTRRRWLTYSTFTFGPLFVVLIVLLAGLNPLLLSGFLDGPGMLGAPLLITLWMLICSGLVIVYRKSLSSWIVTT